MRIINLLDLVAQDIEPPLVTLSASEDRLQAFKAKKLLELVRYLQAKGPAPCACGNLVSRELWLMPRDTENGPIVKIWVDWRDYAPLQDGLPEAHYRFQIKRPNATVSTDARATTLKAAEDVIWKAFGWR